MGAVFITYYKNDGSDIYASRGASNVAYFDLITNVAAEEYDWSRANYIFLEWNTALDGSGISYHPGDSVDNDIVVYAIWIKNSIYFTNTIELSSVADAIRQKTGRASLLTYPEGFIEAIENISTEGIIPNGTINITFNGITDVTTYTKANVQVKQGLIIPEGFAYYNGYLLPQIPINEEGYNYTFIRRNENTSSWDCIQGTSQWRSRSNASLDTWNLDYADQSVNNAHQYSIPIDGDTTTAFNWGEYIPSSNYYGTSNNRKIIWSSHDIMIGSTNNILYRHGVALLPNE